MSRIYRLTDRVKVRIGDEKKGIVLTLSPLDRQQKNEVQSLILASRKGDPLKAVEGMALSLKYALRGVDGLEDINGEPYVPEFENGYLTDTAVDELMNMEDSGKVMAISASWASGVPKIFKDENGQPLEGVEIIDEKKKKAPKK